MEDKRITEPQGRGSLKGSGFGRNYRQSGWGPSPFPAKEALAGPSLPSARLPKSCTNPPPFAHHIPVAPLSPVAHEFHLKVESSYFRSPFQRSHSPVPTSLRGSPEIVWKKFLSPEQSGPKEDLQLLGFRGAPGPDRAGYSSVLAPVRRKGRGGENLAKGSKQGTGWGPTPESLRVVARRPAEGKEIFSFSNRRPSVRRRREIPSFCRKEDIIL